MCTDIPPSNCIYSLGPVALLLSTYFVRTMAAVYEPVTGRALEVHSTEPRLQFYSGNNLDGSIAGKNGLVYRFRSGFRMEPQHFPDSPNHPGFASVVLKPGETNRHTIICRFSAR